MAETPSRARHVGARITRKEDPRMVTGQARYLEDYTPPGALHLRLVRSELAHAEITEIDSSALAHEYPDATLVTGDDVEGLGVRAVQDHPEAQASFQPLLARGRVRFVGEPVAAVLTSDPYRSEDAAERVFIDYEPLPVLADMEAALSADAPRMHPGWRSNLFVERQMAGGDIEAARRGASHVVVRTYATHRQAGVPMECRGVVAELDSSGRWLTVHSSTQIPHLLRTYLADRGSPRAPDRPHQRARASPYARSLRRRRRAAPRSRGGYFGRCRRILGLALHGFERCRHGRQGIARPV